MVINNQDLSPPGGLGVKKAGESGILSNKREAAPFETASIPSSTPLIKKDEGNYLKL
jgi:hypothetical protein